MLKVRETKDGVGEIVRLGAPLRANAARARHILVLLLAALVAAFAAIAPPTPAEAAPPAAPTGLAATTGGGHVALSWTNPNDGSITKYQYMEKVGDGEYGSWTDVPDSDANTTAFTATGLTPATVYAYKIRAVSNRDFGEASDEVTATPTTPVLPSQPTGFVASPRDEEVILNWLNPNDPSISGWEYRQKESSSAAWGSWTTMVGCDAATLCYTVEGLTNDTKYSFQVRAKNSAGDGSESETAESTPTLARPTMPVSFSSLIEDSKIKFTWQDPSDSSITKYQIRRTGLDAENKLVWLAWEDITGSGATTTTHSVTGLSDGVRYFFQIRAVNSVGNGFGSYLQVQEFQIGPPEHISFFRVVGGNEEARLWWQKPGDASITHFEYRQKQGSRAFSDWQSLALTDLGTAVDYGYSVTGLTNGVSYGFQVRSVNANGIGYNSLIESTVPAETQPNKPSGLTAVSGDGQATLNWTEPSDTNIAKYQFRYRLTQTNSPWANDWQDMEGSSATTTSYVVTGLTNNLGYLFVIRTVNTAGGTSPKSESATTMPRGTELRFVSYEVANGLPLVAYEGAATRLGISLRRTPSENVSIELTVVDEKVATVLPNVIRWTPTTSGIAYYASVTGIHDDDEQPDLVQLNLRVTGSNYEGATRTIDIEVREDDGLEILKSLSIPENSPSLSHLGSLILDNPFQRSRRYVLGGEDFEAFDINACTAELFVSNAATLDFETNPTSRATVIGQSLYGVVLEGFTVNVTNVEEPGVVEVSPSQPDVGTALSTTLTDPDGSITGATWQWARSPDGTDDSWTDISGPTSDTYSPVVADRANYLRATASYTDGEGSGKTALGSTANPATLGLVLSSTSVVVGEGLTETYTLALPAEPSGDVTVSVSSDDTAAATVELDEFTIPRLEWDQPRTMTVTGVADTATAEITLTAAGGGYDGVTGAVMVTVYEPATTTGGQSTHGVPADIPTVVRPSNSGPAVEFPGGATTGNPFQVRVDPAPLNCVTGPSGRTLAGCVQVDLFTLDGNVWDEDADGTAFPSATVKIVVTSIRGISVHWRAGPSDPWTTIPRCADEEDTRECFTVSGNEVTIHNIQGFSQFAAARAPAARRDRRDDDRDDRSVEAPVYLAPVFVEGATTTREVAENSPAGTLVGGPITATANLDQPVTYSGGGPDAELFDVASDTGQILVAEGAAFNYESARRTYDIEVVASTVAGPDSTITLTITVINVDEAGAITLSPVGSPEVGKTVTATLIDPDEGVFGESWSWQRSADGTTWSDIIEANSETYTPVGADAGMQLRARVTYADSFGAGLILTESTPAVAGAPQPAATPQPAPTPQPTPEPTLAPMATPTAQPTSTPTPAPTAEPTPTAPLTPAAVVAATPRPLPPTPTPWVGAPTPVPAEATGPILAAQAPTPAPTIAAQPTRAPALPAPVQQAPPPAESQDGFPLWVIVLIIFGLGVLAVGAVTVFLRRR